MKAYKATIKWFSANEGGRKRIPPAGTKCFPIIRTQTLNGDWSIAFACTDIRDDRRMDITFSFLSPDVSDSVFHKSDTFALYEGGRKVAEGCIL